MYRRILVPLDGSATAERGLQEAIALAAVHKARLHLLHVMENIVVMGDIAAVVSIDEMRQSLREQGEKVLAKALEAARAAGVEAEVQLREILEGRAAPAIVAEARAAGCDLIVMGTHGRRGFSRLLLGSDAELVLRTSPVPVMLVRQEEPA